MKAFQILHYACLLDFQAKMANSYLPESEIQKHREDRCNMDRACHDKDGDHGQEISVGGKKI